MNIWAANRDYERWLAGELKGDIVEEDILKKRKRMRESAFAFLRATYWRWAETILGLCPDIAVQFAFEPALVISIGRPKAHKQPSHANNLAARMRRGAWQLQSGPRPDRQL